MSLIIDHVTGGYGHLLVLKDISLDVQPEEIVELIGLNGTGESTTIKHIIDLLETSKGTIETNYLFLEKDTGEYRKQIGYIPETPSLYEELALREHIEVIAVVYDILMDIAMKRAKKLSEIFRSSNHPDWFPVSSSRGMRQKVTALCAFLIEPSLYIIDESFLGLDPLAINALLEPMVEMKKEGADILMSTYILAAIEEYRDRLVVLHNGEIRTDGSLEMLRKEFQLPDSSLDEIYTALTEEQAYE